MSLSMHVEVHGSQEETIWSNFIITACYFFFGLTKINLHHLLVCSPGASDFQTTIGLDLPTPPSQQSPTGGSGTPEVVIAHDVDPIELVCWLPALCRKKDRSPGNGFPALGTCLPLHWGGTHAIPAITGN